MATPHDRSPTQQRLLDALEDGKPHTVAELRALLNDDLSEYGVYMQISNLRKHLRPLGKAIVRITAERITCYQIKLLADLPEFIPYQFK